MKFIFVILLLLSGCAYRAGHLERALPGGYDRVSIPTFSNRTSETGAEVAFTNALIREFERSRMAAVVPKNDAQVILEGTVMSVGYAGTQFPADDPDLVSPVTNTKTGLPQEVIFTKEYRVFVTIHLVARKTSDNSVLWESDVSGEKRYNAPLIFNSAINEANALYNSSARQQTINRMAEEMMSEAHDRLTENF